jgi:LacI family transcriptional regulator
LVTPQISSVEQPCFELGKLAAKLFIETVHQENDMSDVDEVLKTKLFVRESSQRLVPKNNRFK